MEKVSKVQHVLEKLYILWEEPKMAIEQIFNFVNEHYIISALLVFAAIIIIHQLYHTIKNRKRKDIGVTIDQTEPQPAQIQPEPYQQPIPEQQQVPSEYVQPQEEFPIDLQQLGVGEETNDGKDIVEISKEQIQAMNEEIIRKANEYNEKLVVAKDLILQEEKQVYEDAQKLIQRKKQLANTRDELDKNIAFTKPIKSKNR